MKGPRVIHSLLSINRSGQNFYWFYKIQRKYMKERVNNVGMVILLAIFLWVSKWMKQWNKWISLGSRECYRNKQWANGCHNLQLNLEIPKTFLRTKYLKVWKANFKIQTTRNLSWVDFWSRARQQKQTNGSGVINVHFKPTSGHAKHNLSAIYKCKLRESLAIWA